MCVVPFFAASPRLMRARQDASVWNMVGLAIRFAAFLQLERDIEKPFVGQGATDQEIRRMRVWLNLISVDHQCANYTTLTSPATDAPILSLRLTASLPASLDPTIAARVVRVYASHPRAQPLDIKFAGLCELVMIAHRAATYSGDASLRSVDVLSLRKANDELNQWEGVWSAVLGTELIFHTLFLAPELTLNPRSWHHRGLPDPDAVHGASGAPLS